jgi:hypothetical protein
VKADRTEAASLASKSRLMSGALIVLLLATSLYTSAATKPTVLWVSQPIRPNETALVQGMSLDGVKTIHVKIGAGSEALDAVVSDSTDNGLHFVVPPTLRWPAVYEITPAGATEPFLLNAPRVQWMQGDHGRSSLQGGWLRLFGSCLSLAAAEAAPSAGSMVAAEQALRRALDRRDAAAIAHFSHELSILQAHADASTGADVQVKLQAVGSTESTMLSAVNATENTAFILVPADFVAGEFSVSVRAAHTNGSWFPIEWYQSKKVPRASTWRVGPAPPPPPHPHTHSTHTHPLNTYTHTKGTAGQHVAGGPCYNDDEGARDSRGSGEWRLRP